MAAATLSTTFSRRSMVKAGLAAPALALPLIAPLVPVIAAPSDSALSGVDPHPTPDTNPDPDAILFSHIAQAEGLRKRHARARRLRGRLGTLRLHCIRLHNTGPFVAYADAVRAAVAVPAHSLSGVRAKLGLALIAARRGPARVYMYEDRSWLEAVMSDIERLADCEHRL